MPVALALILLALVFAGIGLFVSAAKWALIVAAVLVVTGAVMSSLEKRRTRL